MAYRLDWREEARIKWAIKDRLMHFSATISPAPKDLETMEIESLKQAILYYKEAGQSQVIIQPKYMGSYCDIYLAKNLEETRFFSRRGYPIKKALNEELLKAAKPIWDKFEGQFSSGLKMVIVQAELMPWSCIGEGLIDKAFRSYIQCHNDHLSWIEESDINKDIAALKQEKGYLEYLKDKSISKEILKKKYADHLIKQYEALNSLDIRSPISYRDDINIYEEQLNIYGSDGPIHFKPFNILKYLYEDREIVAESNINEYRKVSDDECLVISFDSNLEEQISSAYSFYQRLTGDMKMEGVIVKPDSMWISNFAPMLKVRNGSYLQMIYGVNFQKDYDYYLKKRNIWTKIKTSINEWNISKALLFINSEQISIENKRYVELVTARILEEKIEDSLDTRL